MKRLTKHILGFLGLILVGTLTVVAYNLPEPVSATDGNQVTDTVVVTVLEHGSSNIESPKDGSEVNSNIIHVVTDYTDTNELEYYLSYYDESTGQWTEPVLVHNFCPTMPGGVCPPTNDDEASGRHEFDLNLPNGYGKYALTVKLKNGNHVVVNERTVTITYVGSRNIPVPNTGVFGAGILSDLNIGRIDFLLTGLIVFFCVAGFSAYLIVRRRKNTK
ncbi:hypothetical protein IJI91_03230 [Candidatus Saccharibacteria bacterium]|nr:hypothetical protein [Candidatus Saccharibacteria bacterium]